MENSLDGLDARVDGSGEVLADLLDGRAGRLLGDGRGVLRRLDGAVRRPLGVGLGGLDVLLYGLLGRAGHGSERVVEGKRVG